jgi:hypothetical protein
MRLGMGLSWHGRGLETVAPHCLRATLPEAGADTEACPPRRSSGNVGRPTVGNKAASPDSRRFVRKAAEVLGRLGGAEQLELLWTTGTATESLAARSPRYHRAGMFVVTEAEAAVIRAAFEQRGELSAAIELRRLFPGITDNVQAQACARTIAGWKPLPVVSRSESAHFISEPT